ncbi:hypothetical protein AC1031_009272 [Aphanomyces cochlioides]|nr:hypothetical protein AC1031_009272 [Aphanomyces cochlioides]
MAIPSLWGRWPERERAAGHDFHGSKGRHTTLLIGSTHPTRQEQPPWPFRRMDPTDSCGGSHFSNRIQDLKANHGRFIDSGCCVL